MARSVDEEEDLDGILDSALDEFDDVPVAGVSSLRNSSCSSETQNERNPGPVSVSTEIEQVCATGPGDRDAPEDSRSSETRENNDEGVRAYEDALKKLNELKSGNVGEEESRADEEEDLKLVEDFLKSLSTQFESMGVPRDGEHTSDDAIPEDLSRELAALFSGAAMSGDDAAFPADEAGDGAATMNNGHSRDSNGASRGVPSSLPIASASESGGAIGPEFEKIVESVVGELLSKDVLKGPMEEMRVAYEQWLPENESTLTATDCERYRKQNAIVGKICALYESGNDNPSAVMNLLQEMQDTGAPPSEVIRQLGDSDDSVSQNGSGPGGPLADLEKLAKCPVQ
jgi:peroxin-19